MRKKSKTNQEIERFSPDLQIGLTTEQVNQRKKEKLLNKTKNKSSKSYFGIIVENTFTYFNLIWAIIIAAYIYVGSYNNLAFVVVIFLNTVIAIIQECKAKHTVEKLSLITAPQISVLRNGKLEKINSTSIVLDDIIYLETGNQIPTDCVVVSGFMEVNESLLTGESNAIKKRENNEIWAGSFVTSGNCYAKVVKVGSENYIQSISKQAKKFKSPNSNLFKDLNTIIKYIGIAIIPIAIIMYINNFSSSHDFTIAVTKTCGALTGMVPAGMFLLVTIALAVGVVKLSKKKTLVQDLYSIEMLARTNMLCLDKTGTITDGTMNVTKVEKIEEIEKFDEIIQSYLQVQKTNNSTGVALIKHFGNNLYYKPSKVLPFSSDRKYGACEFDDFGTFLLGAPEFVCKKMPLEIKEKIAEFYKQGERVLLFVKTKDKIDEENLTLNENSEPVAIICIEDHIRDDAIETLQWFKENGVKIKIISGDNPVTVSSIAKRVGIEDSDQCVSLEGMPLEDVAKIADNFTIFGRVSPEQKYTLVKSLKRKGYIVSMTGDGVNDTLALKESDCSVAMADGSDVARGISNLVLMDSKFSSLPKVVEEGRQVVNNIQKSSTLFLMKTFFTFLFSFFVIILHTTYPYESVQLLLLEIFVIGIPSFILALEPNKNKITGEFISTVIKKALPSALLLFANVAVIILLEYVDVINVYEKESLTVLVLTFTGFLNLIRLCCPLNLLRISTLVLSLLLIMLAIIFAPEFFIIYVINGTVLMTLGILILVSIPLLILFPKLEKIFCKNIFKIKNKKNN